MCTVTIDATEYVGRVYFADIQGELGIEEYDPEFDRKEKISFENEVGKIVIFNAAETGPTRFTLAFSGATYTVAATAATMLTAASLAFF